MKKLLILICILVFTSIFVSGCGTPTLKINNDLEDDIYEVSWNQTSFGTIATGTSKSLCVTAGTAPIFFSVFDGSDYYYYYTDAQVTVGSLLTKTYTINYDIYVWEYSVSKLNSVAAPLKSFLKGFGK